ncbi:MAG: hypothetical protein RR315_02595 [Oscillospiraceae bacterium]
MKIYIFTIVLAALVVLLVSLTMNRALGGFLKSALCSVLTLSAVWLLGLLGIFKMGINIFTVAFSFFFGIPGIITLLFFNILTFM